ncbi:MAG: hypothetical protein RR063_07220, partial [Anaerovoracaceae bacterium]
NQKNFIFLEKLAGFYAYYCLFPQPLYSTSAPTTEKTYFGKNWVRMLAPRSQPSAPAQHSNPAPQRSPTTEKTSFFL